MSPFTFAQLRSHASYLRASSTSRNQCDTDQVDIHHPTNPPWFLIPTHRSRINTMARERRLPSIRSSDFASKKQAKAPAETRDHDDKPAIEKNDVSRTAASSTRGDGTNKHDEHDDREPYQSSSAEVLQETRTFQQLVQDYGNDSKCESCLKSLLFVLDRE